MRVLWAVLGVVALGLGLVGVFMPVLPTVPFMLLAAFCFARGSDRLLNWLLSHPVFGPPIVAWRERGAVPAKAKWLGSLSMAGGFGFAVWLALPVWALVAQGSIMLAAALFIWTRPGA